MYIIIWYNKIHERSDVLMKLISWNVNGLRACMGKGFAEFFASQNADFVCLQETKLQPEQVDFAPEGYFCYWNSAEKKGYSGTAVFAKKEPRRKNRRGLLCEV